MLTDTARPKYAGNFSSLGQLAAGLVSGILCTGCTDDIFMPQCTNLRFVTTHCLAPLALFLFLWATSAPVFAQSVDAGRRSETTPTALQTRGTAGSYDAHFDFYGRGPYRKTVPRPSAILGYEAGERHTTFREQEQTLLAIARSAPDRVRVEEYGKSVEGRPLRLFFVSAPENISRLEQIQARIHKLADPRLLTGPAEAEQIVHSTPTLTWINHCIHGSETASFETVMWTLYTLAASRAPDIEAALKNSVVILNPVFNPDGHERFVVYYNSVAVGSAEPWSYEHTSPWAVTGRLNHYRFDMNRDKVAQSQPETRQETAAFLRWHPQVFIDQHGQPDTYFFPPNSLPQNRHADRDRLNKWTDIFGRANGAAFDKRGWQYVTRETFDLFYPGYLDSFTTLSGAIGMTYETDGGGVLARRRGDQTISTLRDGAAHHLETALTSIVTAANHGADLLRDFAAYRRSALVPAPGEKMRRVVLLPGKDPGRLAELAALLLRVGVEVREVRTPFTSTTAHAYMPAQEKGSQEKGKSKKEKGAGATLAATASASATASTSTASTVTFPAGSLVVDLAQPQGQVARAFLEPDPDFEPSFLREQQARRERNEKRNVGERKEEYEFYDITAWALPYTYNIAACWTEDALAVDARPLVLDAQEHVALNRIANAAPARATVAYLFRPNQDASAFLAIRLLQNGIRLTRLGKPLRLMGQTWPAGTTVALVSRNPDTLYAQITALSKSMGVPVTALNSGYGDADTPGLGSADVQNVPRPRVALIADDGASITSFGAIWHLFETQAGLEFTTLSLRGLKNADLSRFNVIVFPDGGGYAAQLGKTGIDSLREWVGRGNALIGVGGGGLWFTDKDAKLSTASLLGSDDDEAATPDRDKPADMAAGAAASTTPPAATKLKPKKPINLPGAIFRAHIDPTHFLGYGYENGEIAVPLEGATFLKPSKRGANVITFDKGPSRLSGFTWADNTEPLLAGTIFAADEPIGAGHAILFLSDPTYRALWPGLRRAFLNAVLFGPSRPALRADNTN